MIMGPYMANSKLPSNGFSDIKRPTTPTDVRKTPNPTPDIAHVHSQQKMMRFLKFSITILLLLGYCFAEHHLKYFVKGRYFIQLLAGSMLCARAKRQSTPGVCGAILQEWINIYQG